MKGKELQLIVNAKDLGMTWDTRMGYDKHVTNVVTSCMNVLYMQCVQNFAVRIITGTHKYDHITPRLKELKWQPVEKKLYLRDCMAFKCINGIASAYLSEKFCRRLLNERITRQSDDIYVPKFRTAKGQKSFVCRASVIGNSLLLSLIIKNCEHQPEFLNVA